MHRVRRAHSGRRRRLRPGSIGAQGAMISFRPHASVEHRQASCDQCVHGIRTMQNPITAEVRLY